MKKQGKKAAKRIFEIKPILIAGNLQHTSVQIDFETPRDKHPNCDLAFEANEPNAGGFALRAFRQTPEMVTRLWAARYANQTEAPVLDLSGTEGFPMTFRALGLTGHEMSRLMAALAD